MNTDISYLQWERAKVTHHIVTPLSVFNTPDARFDHVHIDLVGPLPTFQGCMIFSRVLIGSLAGQNLF